jgi:ankyrin repeat protein
MKRILRIPWWLRLVCILALLVALGSGLNQFRRWYVNRALMLATERGDAAEIGRRIAEGAEVNAAISHQQTKPTAATYLASTLRGKERTPRKPHTSLLMVAVVSGRTEVVRQLLARNAEVDAHDEYGFTALTMAISKKRPDIVQLLLDYHANPNADNDLGMPPLIWALLLKQTEIAKILLQGGADPNARNRDSLPALYLAVLDEDDAAVRALLEHGADANTRYKSYPVLRTAIEQGDTSIVDALLLHGAHADTVYSDGHTPLELARIGKHPDIAALLIRAGTAE